MEPIRVIVVDDSLFFLQAAIAFVGRQPELKLCGHTLQGEQAPILAAQHRAQAVIMDLSMPTLNGMEVTSLLKKLPQAPKVVIVSLHDSADYRDAAKRAGADAFIPKANFATALMPTLERLFPESTKASGNPENTARVV